MKYRKKPVVIEAEQWFPNKDVKGVRFEGTSSVGSSIGNYLVDTLEGPLRVSPGDWIITGVNGEKYPCNPDIFKKTYEKFDG